MSPLGWRSPTVTRLPSGSRVFEQEQVVVVEADGGGVPEWVAVAVGEEEMLPGVGQFLRRRVGATG